VEGIGTLKDLLQFRELPPLASSVDAIVNPDSSHSCHSPPKNSRNSTGTKTGQQRESMEGIGA